MKEITVEEVNIEKKKKPLRKFWDDNKAGILAVAAVVLIYNIGYRQGFKTCQNAILKAFEDAAKTAGGIN